MIFTIIRFVVNVYTTTTKDTLVLMIMVAQTIILRTHLLLNGHELVNNI
jgi:hypothetical protein